MEIFGTKDKFAIESNIAYETEDHRTIGTIILWVNQERIGDTKNIAPLSVALSTFESILFRQEKWYYDKEFYSPI
jgi:hypothetical protein